MNPPDLFKNLPNRPLTSEENRNLQLKMGLALTHQERFQWLCNTLETLRPLLGKARSPVGPYEAESKG